MYQTVFCAINVQVLVSKSIIRGDGSEVIYFDRRHVLNDSLSHLKLNSRPFKQCESVATLPNVSVVL